jgi:hypothetical protein
VSTPSALAVHEAAHAVADHALLPEFATPSVTIIPNLEQGYLGVCNGPAITDCIDDNPREMKRLMRALVITKLVGAIAESRISGNDLDTLFANGGAEDYDSAQTVANQYARCLFDRCVADARRFVRQRWWTILRVAESLDEKKTLTGLEVEALIGGAK